MSTMEAALTLPAGPITGLFAELGGAVFRRATWLLGDEAAAALIAEELFVRFLVYGNAQMLDERGRWRWIYRVVTAHCLRQLPNDARPGGATAGVAARGLPDGQTLRGMDEATRTILVLLFLDGLTPEEIAEVLELAPGRASRKIAQARLAPGAPEAAPTGHPSTLALDRDRALHADHVASCERCRAVVEEGDRLTAHFSTVMAPAAIPRVGAAVRLERARRSSGPRWKRLFWLVGGFAAVAVLALVVTRPRGPDRANVPYVGAKGASRAKAAGIQISVGHGVEVRALDPATAVVGGDLLYFRVRLERPRYLELRVRDADGERRLFPVGSGDAVEVRPGQALSTTFLVPTLPTPPTATADGGGSTPLKRIWIVGLFADRAFALDRPPSPDVELVPVPVDVQF